MIQDLRSQVDGLKVEAQGGRTARHDGDSSKFALSFGHQFGEKFHLIGSFSEFNQDAISDFSSLQSRPWYNQASRVSGRLGHTKREFNTLSQRDFSGGVGMGPHPRRWGCGLGETLVD